MRKYHIEFVHNAICENKNEIYDSLLWKLWVEENIISPDIFQYLTEKDFIKVLAFTKENFVNISKISLINSFLFSNSRESIKSIIPTMLNFILKNDYELGLEIIRENIRKANAHLISDFTDKIIELKDKSFIELLFERFETESHPRIYLAIAKALISYQDDAINKRVLETRKINDNLNQGWGSKDFNILLKNNDIHNSER